MIMPWLEVDVMMEVVVGIHRRQLFDYENVF